LDATHASTVVIATGGDRRYLLGIVATLYSATATLDSGWSLHAYVLDAGLDAKSKSAIEGAAQRWPNLLSLRFISLGADFAGLPVEGHITPAAYGRFALPEALAAEDRVISLDSDTLVRRSLHPLYALDMGGAPLAAARDEMFPTTGQAMPRMVEACGMRGDEPYLNSGVLVMDLNAWRKRHLSDTLVEHCVTHADPSKYHDQDSINALLGSECAVLPPAWNAQVGPRVIRMREQSSAPHWSHPAVWHFVGSAKPWNPESLRISRLSVQAHLDWHVALFRSRLEGARLRQGRWMLDTALDLGRRAAKAAR
jgi:lipopolysaccharide biosynthesis glycosyltransferase